MSFFKKIGDKIGGGVRKFGRFVDKRVLDKTIEVGLHSAFALATGGASAPSSLGSLLGSQTMGANLSSQDDLFQAPRGTQPNHRNFNLGNTLLGVGQTLLPHVLNKGGANAVPPINVTAETKTPWYKQPWVYGAISILLIGGKMIVDSFNSPKKKRRR